MKRIWNRLCAMLLACALLAALAPAALADDGADAYRIAVSAVPAVVAAGGSTTVSATVYCRDKADGSWREYLDGGAVITWEAYREGLGAFRGESAGKPVTTVLNAGASSASLELLTEADSVTGSAVQLPLNVSVTTGGKTYSASGAFVTVTAAAQQADAEYAAGFGGSVRFSEADFSRAFSGRGKPGETLDYVMFAISRAAAVTDGKTYDLSASGSASMFGSLRASAEDGQALTDTDACYYQASFSQLDLDALTFQTGSCRTRYTVRIPCTAVGTDGTRCEGTVVVTVSGDDTITASGAFLKALDASGQVAQRYPDAVCVSFRQPDASAGRLLKEFRSVAGNAYTAVRYAQERFYLADDKKTEPLLDDLFFLPAADCASQLKLGYTAYDSAGTQLGTGELTVRVASKQSSAVFSDVNAGSCAWAAAAVDFMNGYGLIQGADASTFNWRGSMTRGDLILILYRSAGSPAVSGVSLPFTDVSDADYAYGAICWAWQNKIADGISETEFGMTRPVTREQLASILYRLSGKPAPSASLRSYTDADSVSAYAADALRWATGCGYVRGSGAKLNPQSGANRAETAVLLHRYLTK